MPARVSDLARADDIIAALETTVLQFRTLSDAERAVALCWLLHLLGDLHQPLHTTQLIAPGYLAAGDRGGNEIGVRNRSVAARDLHALWDGAAGSSRDWRDLSDLISGLGPVERREGVIDFRAWALESRALAGTAVYTESLRASVAAQSMRDRAPRFVPDRRYLDGMRNHARGQLKLAARRGVRVLGMLAGD